MESSNSFEDRHEDYAFFLAHSTEPDRCRDEVIRRIGHWDSPIRDMRIIDFGCGGGEFLVSVLDHWHPDPKRISITLIDVDPIALSNARTRNQPYARKPIETMPELKCDHKPFDLILSNHVLYYVPDLPRTVKTLAAQLAPGGLGVWNLGGSGNQLCRLWQQVFDNLSEPLPFNLAEDVAAELTQAGIAYEHESIESVLSFPDTPGNRAKIARFVFGPRLAKIGIAAISPLFEQWKSGDKIQMLNRDDSFCLVREHFAE